MTNIISGQKIVSLNTLKTMYDDDCITAIDDRNKVYRIKVSEFLKVINDLSFRKEKKKIHTYLEIEEEDL